MKNSNPIPVIGISIILAFIRNPNSGNLDIEFKSIVMHVEEIMWISDGRLFLEQFSLWRI
jgi:hypothetical protein